MQKKRKRKEQIGQNTQYSYIYIYIHMNIFVLKDRHAKYFLRYAHSTSSICRSRRTRREKNI